MLSYVDLTLSSGDNLYVATSVSEDSSSLKVSSKRRLSDSSSEDIIDHDLLQASIEQDVLQPTKYRKGWSFGSLGISKPLISSKKQRRPITPLSLSNSDDIWTKQSNQASQGSYTGPSKAPNSKRGLEYSDPSDFLQRPAKRPRKTSIQMMPPTSGTERIIINIEALYPLRPQPTSTQQGAFPPNADVIDIDAETAIAIEDEHRLDLFESDFLDDDSFRAWLAGECCNSAGSDIVESIETDEDHHVAIVAGIKRLTLTGRRGGTVPGLQAQTFPVPDIRYGNHTYKTGKCVEMSDGTFLRIKSIHKDVNGVVWLDGDHLVRTNFQGPMMPKQRNELVWIVVTDDVGDPAKAIVQRKLTEAIRVRKVNFVNQQYEKLNTKTHGNALKHPNDDVKFGELFCRLQRIQVKSLKNGRVLEDSIAILMPRDADPQHGIDLQKLRDVWRGITTLPGGSNVRQIIEVDDPKAPATETNNYTFGDCFCGGGGVTRGAVMAGLHPVFGFDFDRDAIGTYSANFAKKGTLCFHEAVDTFLGRLGSLPLKRRKKYMVDILHISPPCQPFSPAHTRPNWENDAKNQACLFSIFHLLQTIKPRVITVEQTEGLLSRHNEWFSALIHIFACIGYSVRWKVVRCEEYGVPQTRKRLFIIASGPGERLPEIPKPTHGPGLKDFVTIRDVIRNIPYNGTHREPIFTGGAWPRTAFPFNSFARTITTNGGPGNYHPSGERAYTIRELARLQTFPNYHVFLITGVTMGRKQIGNAVPPLLAEIMYKGIIESLKETDGMRR